MSVFAFSLKIFCETSVKSGGKDRTAKNYEGQRKSVTDLAPTPVLFCCWKQQESTRRIRMVIDIVRHFSPTLLSDTFVRHFVWIFGRHFGPTVLSSVPVPTPGLCRPRSWRSPWRWCRGLWPGRGSGAGDPSQGETGPGKWSSSSQNLE